MNFESFGFVWNIYKEDAKIENPNDELVWSDRYHSTKAIGLTEIYVINVSNLLETCKQKWIRNTD